MAIGAKACGCLWPTSTNLYTLRSILIRKCLIIRNREKKRNAALSIHFFSKVEIIIGGKVYIFNARLQTHDYGTARAGNSCEQTLSGAVWRLKVRGACHLDWIR